MRSNKTILSLLAILIGFVPFMQSCTKEAVSNPQFIFKAAPDKTTAAKFGNITITNAELVKGVEVDIYEAEKKVHEIKMNRLQSLLIEKLIDADPKKGNMSYDEYLKKNIASSVKISDKMISDFAKERKIPEAQLNDQMKGRISKFLEMEKKREAIDNWLASKTKTESVEVYLAQPQRPVFNVDSSGAPFMGGANAKVTLVEFSDFQCPFCAKGADVVHDLKKAYGNKIKIVFKQFPLPFHKDAKLAAQAALCAEEAKKGAFWTLHDMMFKDQSNLKKDALVAMAGKAGLDTKKVDECLSSSRTLAQVEKDIAQGRDIGVKSTPTFFVNGMIINGAQPLEVFKELIDSELKK